MKLKLLSTSLAGTEIGTEIAIFYQDWTLTAFIANVDSKLVLTTSTLIYIQAAHTIINRLCTPHTTWPILIDHIAFFTALTLRFRTTQVTICQQSARLASELLVQIVARATIIAAWGIITINTASNVEEAWLATSSIGEIVPSTISAYS